MNTRDLRTFSFYDQVNDLHNEKRTELFTKYPFSGMNLITQWIGEQLKEKILLRLPFRFAFDDILFSAPVTTTLVEGDRFYTQLFADNNLLPSGISLVNLSPLSDTLRIIYRTLWEQPEDDIEDRLSVYADLRNHVEQLMGKLLGPMQDYLGIARWQELLGSFSHYGNFYHTLIDHIPLNEIQNKWNELQYTYAADNVLSDAGYPMSFKEDGDYHKRYVEDMQELAAKGTSTWKYTSELTKAAQYTIFEEALSLKLSLILRLSPTRWVEWLDQIRWPLPQAVAMRNFRNLSVMEELIAAIVQNPSNRLTDPVQLLVIALREYTVLIMDISRNLFATKNDKDSMLTPEKIAVKTSAKAAYITWSGHELQDSIKKVLESIFTSQPISNSSYFNAVADWIAAQNREQWNGNIYREPLVLAIDMLHNKFIDQLSVDTANKSAFADWICDRECNWSRLNMISDLYERDKTDTNFRELVLGKFVVFASSKDFRWNTSFDYNNDVILQTYRAATLILQETDPDTFVLTRIQENRMYHEGWNVGAMTDIEQLRKELYWIVTGISMSYIRYDQGNNSGALKPLQEIIKLLFMQYRVINSDPVRQHYMVGFKFITETLLRFDLAGLTAFVHSMLNKTDDIRDLLPIVEHLATVSTDRGIIPERVALDEIAARIDRDYWQIEALVYLKNHPIISALTTASKTFRSYYATQNVSLR